jgi:hypothetical protein
MVFSYSLSSSRWRSARSNDGFMFTELGDGEVKVIDGGGALFREMLQEQFRELEARAGDFASFRSPTLLWPDVLI